MTHKDFQEMISMDVLGALPKAERAELRHHLAECSDCREQYRQENAVARLLPRGVDAIEPSAETKTKLFARVDADLARANARTPALGTAHPAKMTARRNWLAQPAFGFAALAVLAALAIGAWLILQTRPSPEQQAIAEIISSPNVQKVSLGGTKDAPNAWGEMYMVPGRSQAVLKVGGLQLLPSDKAYEFWFFRGGEPQPSNVFTVNSDGTNTVLVNASDNVENFKGWGVTIEPRAGVPKPTGTIVILGGL